MVSPVGSEISPVKYLVRPRAFAAAKIVILKLIQFVPLNFSSGGSKKKPAVADMVIQ